MQWREFPLRSPGPEAPRRFVGLNHQRDGIASHLCRRHLPENHYRNASPAYRVSRGDYRVLHAVGGRAWRPESRAFGALAEPALVAY